MSSVIESPGARRLDVRESGGVIVLLLLLLGVPAVVPVALDGHTGIATAVGLVLLGGGIVFSSLQVIVADGRLRVRLGHLVTVRDVALADIASAERVSVSGWSGLGIRLLPTGTLYTVTLGDAVEVRMRDGQCFFVGSSSARALSEQLTSLLSPTAPDAATAGASTM